MIGHGSLRSGESSRPIHALASRLRDLGRFGEVRTAFWKEEPQLHYAFDLVEHPEVFVVPFFMGEGYFTQTVLPRELGLDGQLTLRGPRRIHYCPPVGSHPAMARVVTERAVGAVPGGSPDGTTLVLLGHGTSRHPGSADTTLSLVERLQNEGPYTSVVGAFLDQDPALERVLEELDGDAVVVPFFASEGWHVGTTIPNDLALSAVPTARGGLKIWYAEPVGTHPAVAEVVLDLVAGEVGTVPNGEREPLPAPATLARRAFISWIREASPDYRAFLQTVVRCSETGRFEIRHERDQDASPSTLHDHVAPDGAYWIARATDDGVYRPLKTAPDLAGGWRFAELEEDDLWEVYALLYPAAPVHWYLYGRGELQVVSFREAARRQTGRYERTGTLEADEVGALTKQCCSDDRCLREPTWSWGSGTPRTDSGSIGGSDPRVPCPQPCSVLFSAAAKAAKALEDRP